MRKLLQMLFFALFLSLIGSRAGATGTGPDFTTLTTGIDFTTIGAALLAIAVLISGVHLTWKGAKMILAAIKSA